jgi:hypothetical protein
VGDYVSPFAAGGGRSGGGGGTPRSPGAGYTSPRMANYKSPLAGANYNGLEAPDPLKSGFSVGGAKYNNIDHYVASFDKMNQGQRKQQYDSLKKSNDPFAQSIASSLDQKGRAQTTSATQHAKNAATDVGHGASAVGRFLLGGTAKLINQGYQEGKQVVDTTKMEAANLTHNSDAFSNANKQSQKDYQGFQKGKGGILGVGTLSTEKSAKAGELKQGAKDIGGGILMAAGEVLPFAKGVGIGAKGVEEGAQFMSAGRKAELAARAAEDAAKLSKGEKAVQVAVAGGKRLAVNGAYGAVGSTGSQLATDGKVNPFQVAKDAGASAATGEIVHAGGALLSKVFNRGSDAALKDAVAARNNVAINPDTIAAAAKDIPKDTGQKLLPAGNIQNESTSIVKGAPAIPGDAGTPSKVPVSEAEYKQRFDTLSNSYDSGMKAAQAQKGSLAQSIAADQVHEDHLNALNQLDHEFQNGKANPDFKPATSGTAATPDTTVNSGFQIVNDSAKSAVHTPVVANDQRAQLHQRIGQIDSIIKNTQQNGTTRTPEELRGLMRERQAAQGVLDGTHSYQEVYGKPTGDVKSLPFGDNTSAAPGEHKPGDTMPTKDTPVAPGSSMFTTLPEVKAGDTKAPELHRAFVASQYDKLGGAIQDAQKGMTPHDVKLLESIESPVKMTSAEAEKRVSDIAATANSPDKFTKAAAALKDFADARLDNDTALGRDVGKRENYLSRFYERGTTKQSDALDRLNLTGDALPGYTKSRSIATQAEADALAAMKNADGTPKYPQLQRKNANVFEDAKQAVDMAKADHGKQAVKLALEQAHPGVKVGVNKIGFDPESGLTYKGLDTKGGNGLSLPQHLAEQYNKRAPVTQKTNFGIKLADGSITPVRDNEVIQQLKATGGKLVDPVSGKDLHSNAVSRMVRSAVKDPLGTYDKANANLKYSILGGGTFHAVTTGGTVGGQQAMRALTHPLEIPSMIKDNLKLVAGTISKASHDKVMSAHEADGSLSFAKLVGTTLSPKEILGDANSNIVDKMKESPYNPIKQIHDAVFARQIPEAKMMIMKQSMASKFKGMDFNAPTAEQVAYGRKVASAVNNIGGINRAVEGLSPETAKRLSRVLLATDFTEGKMRIMANAITKGGPQGNIARQMVVGKSVLFALPGLAALTIGGQLDWNKPQDVRKAIIDQILDPSIPLNEKGAPTKSNPGGASQAIHFPSTFISEFGKIVKPALDPLQPDKWKGAKDYATNRAAALPAIASRLKQNKDFTGNPIYGTDKSGNPISPAKTALNIGNQVAPIPIVQGGKQASGQQGLRDTLLNVGGLRVSSDPNAATGQHAQAVQDFYTTLNQSSADHSKVSKQISKLLVDNNPAQAYRVAQQYNESLPQRLQPFRQKYNDHYNPAWDTEFKKLEIPLTANSFKARQKTNALQSAISGNDY